MLTRLLSRSLRAQVHSSVLRESVRLNNSPLKDGFLKAGTFSHTSKSFAPSFVARSAATSPNSFPNNQSGAGISAEDQAHVEELKQSSLVYKMLRRLGLNITSQQLMMIERVNIIMISTFLNSACHTALAPVLPTFAAKFGIGAAAVGMTISVFAIARLLLNMPAGVAADKYGRKPLLVYGPMVTAIGMALCGIAHTYTELLIYRFITGIGSAFQMCGAQLYLADVSIRENRARVLGANTSAALLGVSVGPAMGGVMAQHLGSSAPFFVTGSLAMIAALWSALRLKESHPLFKRHMKQSMDSLPSQEEPSALLPGVRGANVTGNKLSEDLQPPARGDLEKGTEGGVIRLRQEHGAAESLSSPLKPLHKEPNGLPAPSALPFNGRDRQENGGAQLNGGPQAGRPVGTQQDDAGKPSTSQPHGEGLNSTSGRSVWHSLLRSRDFLSVSLVNTALFASANGGRGLIMPLAAMEGFAWNPGEVGTLLSTMAAINLIGTLPASYLSDKLGRKATIVPAGFGMALAMLLSALTSNSVAFSAAWIVYAMSQSVLGASPQAFAADLMSPHNRGLALSFYRTWGDIGLLMGPLALGYVMDRAGGGLEGTQVALITNAAALSLAVGNFWIAAREPERAPKRSN